VPTYYFVAKSLKGEEKRDKLEAKNERELAKILREKGFILLRAEIEEKKKPEIFKISLPFFNRVSLVEKLMFTRNLRVMISAGVPLTRAIYTIAEVVKTKRFKKVLFEIAQKIEKGESFSKSLSYFPSIFSELFVSCIKTGEESGTLEESLEILTEQMEREHEIKSKIIGALLYPSVIISVLIVIAILMLTIVVPKLEKVFEELNVELPATTRFVIALGNFFHNFWYLLPFLILALISFFKTILKTESGKKIFYTFLLKIPIFSPLIKKSNCAFFTRNLSSLILAGLPLVKSLEIISKGIGNIYYQNSLKEALKRVKKGEKLSEILKKYPDLYPPLVIQMLAIGEETGETATVLKKLSKFYEEEIDNTTKALTSIIEPLIMVVIGVMIGFFAISMIQPMYSMLGGLK